MTSPASNTPVPAPPRTGALEPWANHRLTDAESDGLRRAAADLRVDPYADPRMFRVAASTAWRILQPVTRARVWALAAGTALRPELRITNLPTECSLPPTPTANTARPTTSGFLSELIISTFTVGLGTPMSYADQRNGRLYHDVFPTPGNAGALSSQSSQVSLGFHSEMFFHPTPPDFLALHCLRADPDGNASTAVASVYDMIAELDAAHVTQLCAPNYALDLARLHGSYVAEGRAIRETDPRPLIPVIARSSGTVTLRFEPELTTPTHEAAAEALQAAKHAAPRVARIGHLSDGELLLVDNRVTCHARSPFVARFDGSDRWLRRMMISASRPSDAGHVPLPGLDLTRGWLDRGVPLRHVPYALAPASGGAA